MSTYHLRQRLIDIARRELGTTEVGTSNTGKRVGQYQATTTLGGTGWPWCAAFVCWCTQQWLKDAAVRSALGLATVAEAEAWRPQTAAAFGFHEWAVKRGLLVMNDSPGHVLHTGDLVTFDSSHIGILVTDEGPLIHTIDGNTNGQGSRDGGGVWEKTRPRESARRFIRLLP
jgi:hypothetical protein